MGYKLWERCIHSCILRGSITVDRMTVFLSTVPGAWLDNDSSEHPAQTDKNREALLVNERLSAETFDLRKVLRK